MGEDAAPFELPPRESKALLSYIIMNGGYGSREWVNYKVGVTLAMKYYGAPERIIDLMASAGYAQRQEWQE